MEYKESNDTELLLITLEGTPVPWAAPTVTRKGTYDKRSKHKHDVIWHLKSLGLTCLDGPLRLNVTFMMPIPKSWSKKKQIEAIGTFHTVKPDRGNLLKLLEDCLERASVIRNDSMICDGSVTKIWWDVPQTKITIVRLE